MSFFGLCREAFAQRLDPSYDLAFRWSFVLLSSLKNSVASSAMSPVAVKSFLSG